MIRKISGASNANAKLMRSLKSRKGREVSELFMLEGRKLIQEAIENGIILDTVIILDKKQESFSDIVSAANKCNASLYCADDAIIGGIADAVTPQDIVASARMLDFSMPDMLPEGLLLGLDTMQDPGNLGSVLRSADAMGAAGVLLGPGCADPLSPKAVRSAMGSTFHLPIWQTNELAYALRKYSHQGGYVLAAHLDGCESLPALQKRTIVLIGNEGHGLSEEVAECADTLYRLPMRGRAESLNASVAAALLLYECTKALP